MAIEFEKYNLENTKVFNYQIVKDILGAYEEKDINHFFQKIKELKDVDFSEEERELRECFTVKMFATIEEVQVYYITEKYQTLREKINKVIAIKNKFTDYKKQWITVQKLVDSMYERNKDAMVISEEMKVYKNKDEKLSATNSKLDELIKAMTYIEIVLAKLKQFEQEIKDAMDYLIDVKQDVSRVQSAIVLALDTGEIPRTYWRQNGNNH